MLACVSIFLLYHKAVNPNSYSPHPPLPPMVDAMSVCCRKYKVRSVVAVPPWVLCAAATPLSSLWLDPKRLLPLSREQILHRNQAPRNVYELWIQTDPRKCSNGQLMITNTQRAECSLFLLFAHFLFLFCFADSLARVKDVWIKQRERQGCSVQCRDTHWYI